MTSWKRRLAWIGIVIALLTGVVSLRFGLSRADSTPAPKYVELGKGPTLVLVHDFGSSRVVWMPTARKLADRYHVVIVDLPGHGDSPLPEPFTTEAAAAALGQVLTKWDPDSTVVVGRGMGGVLSLVALQSRPGKVNGVVLIDVGLRVRLGLNGRPITDTQKEMVIEALETKYDRILRNIYANSGRDRAQSEIIHAMALNVPVQTMKSFIAAWLKGDASPALEALTVPYLLVATDAFYPYNPSTGLMLRDMGYDHPRAVSLRRIHDAGSLVMQDQPDTLAAVLSDFAAQVMEKK